MRQPIFGSRDRITRAVVNSSRAAWGLVLLGVAAQPVFAAPVAISAGADYSSGPGDQTTRSAVALASAGIPLAGRLTLGGMRFDDNVVGYGNAAIGVADLPVMATARFVTSGTWFVGDQSFRAWRIKAGPQVTLPGSSSLGFYYSRFEQQAGPHSNGFVGELNVPVVEQLAVRGSAEWSRLSDASDAGQGMLGLTWFPVRRIALSGDVGISRNGSVSFGSVPSSRGRGGNLPLLGSGIGSGGGSTTTQSVTTSTHPAAQLSLRLTLP